MYQELITKCGETEIRIHVDGFDIEGEYISKYGITDAGVVIEILTAIKTLHSYV